jgi:AcrR family transcriptional regulator
LAQRDLVLLEPRKSPVQARSTASVQAIMQATIQVLLKSGKERLTTTRVALRAGVSVGTLYQYFPNKRALLQAALRRHLDEICVAVENTCEQHKGQPLETMVAQLATAFLAAKMKDVSTSASLYAVSSDVDGARISRQVQKRTHDAIAGMLRSSCQSLRTDPEIVASVLQGIMTGISRRILESDSPGREFEALGGELLAVAIAYIKASL